MNKSTRVFWGIGFITAAVFLVLSQFDLITPELSIYHVLIGLLCVALFISSLIKGSFGGVFFSFGLAWLTFDTIIGLPVIEFWAMIGIVVFLTVGFNLVFPRKKKGSRKHDWSAYEKEDQIGEHQKVENVEENGFVNCSNSFGALAKYVNAADFKGGEFSNSFGELKVYLDQANIMAGPIEIKVSNSFGKTSLFVPKTWDVVQDVNVFAGNVSETNRMAGQSGQAIVNIVGNSSFGEVEIIYV